jgi:hypothetical protein
MKINRMVFYYDIIVNDEKEWIKIKMINRVLQIAFISYLAFIVIENGIIGSLFILFKLSLVLIFSILLLIYFIYKMGEVISDFFKSRDIRKYDKNRNIYFE